MIKYILIAAICLTTALVMVACGPKTQTVLDESKLCTPQALTIDSTGSHLVRIAWNPGCPGTRIMRGFQIFLSPTPLVSKYPGREMPESIPSYNKELYPGDQEGREDRETFKFEDLPLSERYYVHVRVVNSDGSYSLPTNEIEVVSQPQGIIRLGASYSGTNDGFSFVRDAYCGTDDAENDMYFYHKDGVDYLCSPSRLSAVNRNNAIFVGTPGSSAGNLQAAEPTGDPREKVEMRPGGIYLIETEDGHLVRVKLLKLEGAGDDRMAIFEYYYAAPVRPAKAGA